MQEGLSSHQRDGFRQIDDKTLQCPICLCKFNKILKDAHSRLHTKTSDYSVEMKDQTSLKSPLNAVKSSQLSRFPDSQDIIRLPQKHKSRSSISQILLKFRKIGESINQLQQIHKRSNFIIILHYFRKLKKLYRS